MLGRQYRTRRLSTEEEDAEFPEVKALEVEEALGRFHKAAKATQTEGLEARSHATYWTDLFASGQLLCASWLDVKVSWTAILHHVESHVQLDMDVNHVLFCVHGM